MEPEVNSTAMPAAVLVPRGAAPPPAAIPGRRGSRLLWREHGVTALLLLALPLAAMACTSVGAVRVPLHDLLVALLRQRPLTETQHTILFAIRLPRVLASAIVGAALAVSGLMFQGLFRNPLADPYIIGASGGAAFGACLGIVLLAQVTLFGFSATAVLAFLGAVLTMIVVYALARSRGRTSSLTLLLAGFAVGTILSNSTYLFELFDPNPALGHRIVTAWLHGSIGTPGWGELAMTAVLLALGGAAALPLMRRLDTLALGDEYAHQLGLRVESTRIGIILIASLFTAIAVALGGLIGFAGLIVPHVVRLLIGPEHTRMLPVTALTGALFLILTDTLARTLFAPSEMPVGILMVFLGGPFFLYLLRRGKRESTL